MIVIDQLKKTFDNGQTYAVNGVSLTVQEGETIVLLGSSGCGKTTTLKMINRLIEPSAGSIVVDGCDIMRQDVIELRRSIGYVFQGIGLMPHLSVVQNVEIPLRLRGTPAAKRRDRALELLALVDLPPDIYAGQYPDQMSGGQQQRVGVARALATDPKYLLMDEPFGAVDPITREVLQEEFLQVQKEISKTIIFVTHDIDEAIKMGDRIAILRDGKLVQYDTPDTILAHPKDRFVRDFVGADRHLKRLGLRRVFEIMDTDPPVVEFNAKVEDALKEINKRQVRSAFVVGREGRLRGWIDRASAEQSNSLTEAMHEAPYFDIAVKETATVRDALSAMVTRGFRITPVVDEEGRLKGSITLRALQEMIEQGDEAEPTQRSAA